MADPNDTLDPEPVDAEFEPAGDTSPAPAPRRRGPGWTSLFLVFLLSSAAGGALGYAGHAYLGNTATPADTGADAREALAEDLTALTARLETLENSDPATPVDDEARARIEALITRLSALEARPAAGGGEPVDLSAIEARLAALESAPASSAPAETLDLGPLEDRIAQLESGQSDTQALASQALDTAQTASQSGVDPQILQNLTQRIADLEAAGDTGATQIEDPAPRLDALESELARLEGQIAQARALAETAQSSATDAASAAQSAADRPDTGTADRQLAARALALTALREIAQTGESFEAERAALARLWRDNADLDALASVARAGVPTHDQLEASYPGAAIREAAGPGRVFFGLIAVRQTDGTSDSTGPMAITALAETRLAEEDLDSAITLTEQLSGPSLESARDWLISARARQDVDRRLLSLRQALADEAAARGEDPS
ncbi:hypothetical protein [Maricaulis parjimensis]|uniref:hypothetical protein n=1 Tax=Maricaulis parjimensis TaxID=144023 RepID=UPI0019396C9C|nr:hypothetical protein [Maricaulis parjimensis]